jgi:hypothetical protein
VAPNGSATGQGTLASPWDLATALNGGPNGTSVHPGDTIWLRGGTYRGGFVCNLIGTPTAPIIVRNYQRERAILDNGTMAAASGLRVPSSSSDVWFWGLEFKDSEPTRVTTVVGSRPPIPRGNSDSPVDVFGPNIKLINCISHDGTNGIGVWNDNTWSTARNAEVYGCLVYNNGWYEPGQNSHGHGIYMNNVNSPSNPSQMQIRDTILWNNFGWGVHAYDGGGRPIENMLFEGMISFNNGAPRAAYSKSAVRMPNIDTTGTLGTKGNTIRNCYLYQPAPDGNGPGDIPNLLVGYPGTSNVDLTLEDNCIAGGLSAWLQSCQSGKSSGNIFMGHGSATRFVQIDADNGQVPTGFLWDNNTYYDATTPRSEDGRYTFRCKGVTDQLPGGGTTPDLRFPAWRSGTGFDTASKYYAGGTLPNRVFVRPNSYETGRANIIVYNWELRSAVNVELSGAGLVNGQAFEIRNVQNYFGTPVLTGTYDSAKPTLCLPMTDATVTAPIGFERYPIASTLPEFGAFVLLPQ